MFRLTVAALLGAAVLGVAPLASAGPRDARAEKALAAIEDDYLETRFDAAEQKLRVAIEECGQTMCTPRLKARLYAALGSVLGSGKKQLDEAKEAFVSALELDREVKPSPDMSSTESTFAFEQ